MTTHTPAPSPYFTRNGDGYILDGNEQLIAKMLPAHPTTVAAIDEQIATIQLLTASPDLLAALQLALPWMAKAVESGAFSGCVMPSVAQRAYDAMNAAIAKATGVQP